MQAHNELDRIFFAKKSFHLKYAAEELPDYQGRVYILGRAKYNIQVKSYFVQKMDRAMAKESESYGREKAKFMNTLHPTGESDLLNRSLERIKEWSGQTQVILFGVSGPPGSRTFGPNQIEGL